jgi:hypothetical protein
MMDRLFDLLGGQVESMLEITPPENDAEAPGQEQWSGWISTPDITRGKGDDIHILINERPVAAGPFLQAIRRGYRTRLMQGRHPIAVLSLTLPPEEVDVNVHPTKREVRLRHSWRVLERLERAIAHTLESVPTQPDAAGGIPGLQGLGIQKVTPIQEHLSTVKAPTVDPLDAAAGAPTLVLPRETKTEAPPAWAIAAGAQLNLHGVEASEPDSTEKMRPQSTAPEAQETLPGMDEKPFKLIKFKTMNDNRDKNGNLLSDAKRLTTVGRWIRKLSLDEVPQLLNVIMGDMSLIGPRPLLMEYLSLYTSTQLQRHAIRPGITGWAQVNGRNTIDWEKKFEYDIWYVKNCGAWLDVKILCLTVIKVLKIEGVSSETSATMEKFTGSSK